jgi:hypothetical protein
LVLIKGVIHSFFGYPGKTFDDLTSVTQVLYLLGIYVKACGEVVEAVKEFMESL